MGWRIIEINKNCHTKLFLGNLIISGDRNISIPINDIDVILFTNYRTNVSVNLINELVNNNVCVFFCNSKYLPTSMVFPIIGNLLTLKIFNEQINWTSDFKGRVWKKIIELKCLNQLRYLKHLNRISNTEYFEMLEYIKEIEINDTTNREGHIAKIYWHKLFGTEFYREKDNVTSLINSILNYGYTILNGMVARSIIKKGLDCRVSINHKSVYNQFALSSDLIEPFRNVIDILAIELSNRGLLKTNEINLTIELKEIILDFVANFRLIINGLSQQLNNAIDEFVDSIVNKSIFDLTIEYYYDVVEVENGNDNQEDIDVSL